MAPLASVGEGVTARRDETFTGSSRSGRLTANGGLVDIVRVAPVGELADSSVPLFMLELDEAVVTGRTVVIDLRDVTTIDVSALEAVAEAERFLRRQGGQLRIENPSSRVRSLLSDLGFSRALTDGAAA